MCRAHRREQINRSLGIYGISCIVRSGAPWPDLPEELGELPIVCRQFRGRTHAGLWKENMGALKHRGAEPEALPIIGNTPIDAALAALAPSGVDVAIARWDGRLHGLRHDNVVNQPDAEAMFRHDETVGQGHRLFQDPLRSSESGCPDSCGRRDLTAGSLIVSAL